MKTIFEAVDCTDEEMYFTIGLWPNLKEAIKAIEGAKELWEITDQSHDEYCKVEIRERAIGFSDVGVKKAVFEWEMEYNEAEDEYQWERKPVEITEKL